MLRRSHDHRREVRTRTRSARLFARRDQDRHVMIEITPSATSQRHPFLPLVVRQRRWRSPGDALGASRDHRHHEKYDRIADRQRCPATLRPSKSSFDRQSDRSTTDAQRLSNPHRSRRRHRRPSDSRFRSLEAFGRRPCPGSTAMVVAGPASETLHTMRNTHYEQMCSALPTEPRTSPRAHAPRPHAL